MNKVLRYKEYQTRYFADQYFLGNNKTDFCMFLQKSVGFSGRFQVFEP